jgi:hypothetical protein
MNSETSRKIVVAGSMAGVLAIGIVVFSMRHHSTASVAALTPPPAPTADNVTPAPPEAVPTPPAPAPMPPVANLPTSPAIAAPSPVQSTPAPARSRARPNSSAAVAANVATPAAVTAAPDADSAKTADASPPPAVADTAGPGADASNGDTATTASDPQITSEVKSVLADDSVAKESNIDVNTSQGVVALTGSVPDQSALDHVVDAVKKVKDVRRVDASAVTVTNL